MMPILACSTSFLVGWACLCSAEFVARAWASEGSATRTAVVARGRTRQGSRPAPITCGTPARSSARLATAGRTYTVTFTHRQP